MNPVASRWVFVAHVAIPPAVSRPKEMSPSRQPSTSEMTRHVVQPPRGVAAGGDIVGGGALGGGLVGGGVVGGGVVGGVVMVIPLCAPPSPLRSGRTTVRTV